MIEFDFTNPVCVLSGNEFLPKEGISFAQQVLEFFISQGGVANSPWGEILLDMKGIQSDKSHGIGRIKTKKIPEIAASSLVRGSNAASPQSLGNIAKILMSFLKSK